jgi:hypothetical protein
MKKLFATLFLFSIMESGRAQKGSALLFGNLGYGSRTSSSNVKESNYYFWPGLGYQFNPHWTSGVSMQFSAQKIEVSAGHDRSRDFQVGPFIRYNHTLGPIFSFFSQANLSYLTAVYLPADQAKIRQSGFEGYLYPAIAMSVKKGWALNFSFGGIRYRTSKYDMPDLPESRSFNVDFGNHLEAGISKNFGGKK